MVHTTANHFSWNNLEFCRFSLRAGISHRPATSLPRFNVVTGSRGSEAKKRMGGTSLVSTDVYVAKNVREGTYVVLQWQ